MGKKIAKFVGIGMLCVVAVLGIGIGIFALTGGFDQTVIVLTSLYFDEQTIETEGYVMNIQDVRTEDDAALSIKKYIVISEDYTIAIGCLPADATNKTLEVTVAQVTAAIEVPKTVKAGEKFTIKVKKDEKGNNIGGSAKLSFKSESGVTCELYVIVDIVLDDADIKLDVSGFSSISPSTATGSSLGGNNRYVLARKNGIANLTLESDLANAFKINQSGISNRDFTNNTIVKFFDKKVYVFADQEDVVTVEQNKTAPVTYDITLNLEQVQGSNLTLFVRTHRTYEMQQEFESLGFEDFIKYYREGYFDEDKIENTFNNENFALHYMDLISKYSAFVNKYYDYIVTDRDSSEFFEQFKDSSGKVAFSFLDKGESFFNQIWESLKYVFVNADIDLFISDIDIKTMQVLADSQYIMEVFENKTLTLEELISAFEIILENDDVTVMVEEEDKLALLSNMVVGIYVDDKTKNEKDNETLENKLKEIYNVGTLQNGNGLTYDSDKEIVVGDLHSNNQFVALTRNGNNFKLEALVPSKYVNDQNFQIYIVFSIAITKSTGTTSIFYDFGKIDVTYEEEVSFEGGMPHSNISYTTEMCVNNNNVIPEDTEVVNGAIGTQTIEVDMNRVLGANSRYAVPKFFIEKTSNEYSYEGTREYLEIGNGTVQKAVVGKNGEENVVYNGLDIAGYPIREFISMEGDTDTKYTYNDKILQAYEIPVTHKYTQTGLDSDRNIYTIDIEAINALYGGSVKIFWACVLVDKDGNPIDRDGNRLFNNNGKPIIGGDMGAVTDSNVSYVVLYSSLDISGANYFENVGINIVSVLEDINFYSQNSSSTYIYKTKSGEFRSVANKEYFLRNHRDDIEDAYTRLRLISREIYDDALVVSGFNLATEVIDGKATLYPSFTTAELLQANEKGIDLYGNIYQAMERALTEENFGFSSSENDYVVATFNNNKVVATSGGEGGGAETVEPEPIFADTTYWKISLEAFDFDRTNELTTCSLSLNTDCKLYELLNDCIVRMQVSAPKITNISAINYDVDTDENKIVGLENFNKQIFIDGEFSTLETANAGDIDWKYTYFENGEVKHTDYTFYSTGTYKVNFRISTEGSNMELLSAYYEKEIERILREIGEDISAEEIAQFENKTTPIFERVKAISEVVERLNNNGRNIQDFNPLIDSNIVDIMRNNSTYISEYLNKLIHYNIDKVANISSFEFKGTLDDAISLVQNYGVSIVIASDAIYSDKIEALSTALNELKTKNMFIGLTDADIESIKVNSDGETLEDNLLEIQAVMTKILTNSPTYDEDFVNVRTVLKNAIKYDLKDLADKFIKAYRKETTFFDSCQASSDIINAIIGSGLIKDRNANNTIELLEIIGQINEQIDKYNESVSSAEALEKLTYSIITDNLAGYFEDGKLLADNEIILNDDGTLPLKNGFRDNLVFNVGLQFRFYPTNPTSDTIVYVYTIEKEYSFYMNFKAVSLEVSSFDLSAPIEAGKSIDLSSKIVLTGINANHVTLEIPYGFQHFLYFLDEDSNRVYSIKASTSTMLHIDNLVNDDIPISILVSIPYYNQQPSEISAMIKHNIDVEFNEMKFVSSANATKASEVLDSDSTGYYDLTNFVKVTDSTGATASEITVKISEIAEGASGRSSRISLVANKLRIASFNLSGEQITLTVKLYDSQEKLVATFTKTIEILPYYRVTIDTYNNANSNFGGDAQTYYLNQVLSNHFNVYDLDLIKVSVINPEDYSYRVLDIDNVEDRENIRRILGYSGVHDGVNDNIEEIPDITVLGTEIRTQFYAYNGTTLDYEQTYLGSTLKNWVSADGNINLPELSKTVIVPIKLNMTGYMGSLQNTYLYLKVGGIEKFENKDGLGDIDNLSSYNSAPYESGSNSYKQNFTTLSLNANGTYNLDEYIQLVLSELNDGEEYNVLKVSYSLSTTVEDVEFKKENNTASIMVEGEEVSISGVLTIGENVADGTEVTLTLNVYKIVNVGANIIAEEIVFEDTLTIKIVNQPVVTE